MRVRVMEGWRMRRKKEDKRKGIRDRSEKRSKNEKRGLE